jgi:hypothetical protein
MTAAHDTPQVPQHLRRELALLHETAAMESCIPDTKGPLLGRPSETVSQRWTAWAETGCEWFSRLTPARIRAV